MVTSSSSLLLASNTEITDAFIIDKVLDGQRDLYEVIVRRYNTKLYRIAKGILQDEDQIEDAMQSAYIKAYEKLEQFKGTAQFSTWIIRILINEALATHRRNNKHIPFDSAYVDRSESTPLPIENQEKNLMQNQVKDLLETAISKLPDKYRNVFMLREIEHLSVRDTSQLLGITEDNVKIRLYRAKGILKDSLKDSMANLNLFEFLAPRCNKLTQKVMKAIG